MSGGASATTVAAVVAAAASAAGAAVSAQAAMQNANAQAASAKFQSQVAAGNQQTALQNAAFAAASGEQQAAVQEQKTRAQIGAIEASQGSSGVDVNSTTATNVRTSQGELGKLDAETIRSNAARQAYGYETQGNNFGNSSSADVSQAQNAETAGDFSAGAGLLSGAGNAAANYSKVMNNSTGINSDASNYINSSPQDQVSADIAAEG